MSSILADKPVGHKERVKQTKLQILAAAVTLFADRGVSSTTVSAIIEQSSVSRATFYRYFDDIADVLNSALQHDFDNLLADFESNRYEHASLEAQIIEDFIWFVRQLSLRPALALLFSDDNQVVYQIAGQSIGGFREAGLICSKPTYERAKAEDRLRDDVSLEEYVDWATFVVTSLQVRSATFTQDELHLRRALQKFFVPSLIC